MLNFTPQPTLKTAAPTQIPVKDIADYPLELALYCEQTSAKLPPRTLLLELLALNWAAAGRLRIWVEVRFERIFLLPGAGWYGHNRLKNRRQSRIDSQIHHNRLICHLKPAFAFFV